jgi:hypothetical protein
MARKYNYVFIAASGGLACKILGGELTLGIFQLLLPLLR